MPARYSVLLNKPDFLQSATRSVLLNKLVNVLKKKEKKLNVPNQYANVLEHSDYW